MKFKKNFMLKTAFVFLFLIAFEASAMVHVLECKPYKLKRKEWHSIFHLIKYPVPLLKSRTWKAIDCHYHDSKLKRAIVESLYYEMGTNYVRYYSVLCEKVTEYWRCPVPEDKFQLTKSKETIWISTKLSTNEILQIIEYINKIDFSSIKNYSPDIKMHLRQLFKNSNVYFAGFDFESRNIPCRWWVKIFPIGNNRFRSDKPEQICVG